MIKLTNGNILKAEAEALVNTVNCVGVMGRGIALQFKKAFPENYKLYEVACSREEVKPGSMFIHDTGNFINPRYIINFPTKRHWKGKSKMEDIDSGLTALVAEVENRGIKSIAIPPLGCGLGGLAWAEVLPRIQKAFSALPEVEVLIYEPGGAPVAEEMAKDFETPNMTIGRASLIALVRRYLSAVMDPTVTLLEVQKLMYFMQEAGEPLRLKYEKAPYGPYAKNLSHVLNHIEGHFISGYLDGGDKPDKPIELKEAAIQPAEEFLKDHNETMQRFEQVNQLIQGFETPYGMELLSTVHWVAKNNNATTPESAVANVYAWNDRKRMFPAEHIHLALDVLKQKHWLH
jgi:O-acetyl-ADP-ribose deacetylase (regulator of RNase III)